MINDKNEKVTAVILAAGMGSRMDLGYNKIFYNFDKPLICYTVDVFEKSIDVDEIVVVVAKGEVEKIGKIFNKYNYLKIKKIVEGGNTRQESSKIGVESATGKIILIQDGARPFTNFKTVSNSIRVAKIFGSAVVSVPCKDTVKLVDEKETVKNTLDRSSLWMAQTPQVFKRDIILAAHNRAKKENFIGTDEASLVENMGNQVKVVLGSYDNIKITTKEDLLLAQLIIDKHTL